MARLGLSVLTTRTLEGRWSQDETATRPVSGSRVGVGGWARKETERAVAHEVEVRAEREILSCLSGPSRIVKPS
jgi:hypothetical protein